MDERLKDLLEGLELYIQEHWIAPPDGESRGESEEDSDALSDGREALSKSYDKKILPW